MKNLRKMSLILALMIFIEIVPVKAATVTIGSNSKLNFVNAQFYVLGNSNIPTRTSISGKDNGYIAPGDLCKIQNTSDSTYWKVQYPTSKGNKTAYVKKSSILSNTTYAKNVTLDSNETVYKKSDMKSKFGTVYKTDKVYMLSSISNGKAQIMYPVTGGYKIGWIYAKSKDTAKVNGVRLNMTNVSLTKGKTKTLVPTILPSNAANKSVTWTSSNTKVAKVDSNGKVTAVGTGTANIIAKTTDGNKTASCTVKVTNYVPVSKVNIYNDHTGLMIGSRQALEVTVSPKSASNKKVIWKSSNTKVATVDAYGNVKGVGRGTATITATSQDGNKIDKCTVNVLKKGASKIRKSKGWYAASYGDIYEIEGEAAKLIYENILLNKKFESNKKYSPSEISSSVEELFSIASEILEDASTANVLKSIGKSTLISITTNFLLDYVQKGINKASAKFWYNKNPYYIKYIDSSIPDNHISIMPQK